MSASLTADEIDKALADWRERIRNASENLLALYDLTAMKRMDGRDGFSKVAFTGVTAARVSQAQAAIQQIFAQLDTLNQNIDRAESLRKSLTRLRRYDETREEITKLIDGNCVALPPDQTPLSDRSLLSVSQQDRAISLDSLLNQMTEEFETAKESVLAVDAAWTQLEPRLDAAIAKATALSQRASALGMTAPAGLLGATAALEALKVRVLGDPLGIADTFEQTVSQQLEAARAEIEESADKRELLTADLARARRLRDQVKVASSECARSYEDATSRIADLDGSLLRPSAVDQTFLAQIEEWLSSLGKAFQSAQWKALQVGLNRFFETVSQLCDNERAATAANRAALDAIPELKGRLSIVESRAHQANGPTNGASSSDALARLSAQAEALLQQNPIPLLQATRLVEACEARLRRNVA